MPCPRLHLLLLPGLALACNSASIGAPDDPSVATAPPVAFWASQPVDPDETVLVTGGNLDGSVQVELAQLPDGDPGAPATRSPSVSSWTSLAPLTATTRSVTATVPASWTAGVYALRLRSGPRAGSVQLVNAPDPWFVQGDQGSVATPGGYLYVSGTCLERTGGAGPQAALVNPATGAVAAALPLLDRITTSVGYALRYRVPASVAEGEYQLWLHNGRGGSAGWVRFRSFLEAPVETVTVKQVEAWPSTVFDVTKQAGSNDDARFAAALAAVEAAGGGRVYVPAGTYSLSTQLALPDRTVLCGDGKAASRLMWSTDPGVLGGYGRSTLVRGKQLVGWPLRNATFALEGVSIEASDTFRGDVVERDHIQGRGWLHDVRIRAPAPWMLVTITDASGKVVQTPAARTVALWLNAVKDTFLDDVELDAANGVEIYYNVHQVRLTRSTIHWRSAPVAFSGGRSNGLVAIGNTLNQRGNSQTNGWYYYQFPDPGLTVSAFGPRYWGGPYTKDLLWTGNRSTRDDKSEAPRSYVGYTSDGFNGIYVGRIGSGGGGTTLTLAGTTAATACTARASDGTCSSTAALDYNGATAGTIAQIVDGKGAGQWRYLVDVRPGASSVTLDRAWDVPPDATSLVALNYLHGRLLFVDNDWALEPKNQDYFLALDVVKAGNRMGPEPAYCHFVTWTGTHYDTLAPVWHLQVLGNQTATEARYTSMVVNTGYIPGYSGVNGAAHVYRNNTHSSTASATLYLTPRDGALADILAEHNQLTTVSFARSSDGAIHLSGVLLRANTQPGGGASTAVSPSEPIDGVTRVP